MHRVGFKTSSTPEPPPKSHSHSCCYVTPFKTILFQQNQYSHLTNGIKVKNQYPFFQSSIWVKYSYIQSYFPKKKTALLYFLCNSFVPPRGATPHFGNRGFTGFLLDVFAFDSYKSHFQMIFCPLLDFFNICFCITFIINDHPLCQTFPRFFEILLSKILPLCQIQFLSLKTNFYLYFFGKVLIQQVDLEIFDFFF